MQLLRLRKEKGWLAFLSPRALRTDLALLDHYNWQKHMAWPSYETLCRESGLSRNTLREALRELALYGLWDIGRTVLVEGGKVRRLNVYRLPAGLVPDPPPARYASPDRYTRAHRLPVLRSEGNDSSPPYAIETADDDDRQSRALSSRPSRALSISGVNALGSNNALNHEEEPRSTKAEPIHPSDGQASPNGEEPRREEVIHRYRTLWRETGRRSNLLPGICRALARALSCSEDEASVAKQ